MKKIHIVKKIVAVILVVFTIASVFSIAGSATSKSANEALSWVKSQVGKSLDSDGYPSGQPYQCVDLIVLYYRYLGATSPGGNGCDYAWNALPSGWTRVQGGTPQPGDILVYSGNSSNPYGHVAIYESDRSHYHQNFDLNPYVQQVTYRYNSLGNPYWGYIRPNWSSGGSSTSYFTSVWAEGIGDTDATIYATTNLTYVQRTGFYIGTSTTNMTRKIEDTYANVLKAWFTMSDCGITLKPATTYYYKIFIIVGDQEYCTEVKSFKTTGSVYSISYNSNGGSGAPSTQTKTTGQKLTLSSTVPTRSGYTFKCWNTKSDGSGTNYYSGGVYSADANVTLFAQWTKNAQQFKITYNANGGSSIIPYEYVEEGKTTTLTTPFKYFKVSYDANGGENAPSSNSLSVDCLGWSASNAATSATYKCGATYKPASDVTLYAVWEDSVQTKLSSQKPVREGYTFLGWSEDPNATEADLSAGETVNVMGDGTLYAVWGTDNTNTDTGYTWWEWIIIIVLFGWIWYI